MRPEIMKQAKADFIIDARNMEPPEPFVATMDALETLPQGHKLLLILTREPYPLYRALQREGYAFKVEITEQGTAEILIWRTGA